MAPVNSFLRRIARRAAQPVLARLDEQRLAWTRLEAEVRSLAVDVNAEHRTFEEASDVLAAGVHAMRADMESLLEWGTEAGLDKVRHGGLSEIDVMAAEVLNRASSPGGFIDRAGLWVDTPLRLEWAPGRVWVSEVTARILVDPFVLRELSDLPVPARVLDLTDRHLTLDVSIASLGHVVAISGRKEVPIPHPRLEPFELEPEKAVDDDTSFHAVIAVVDGLDDVRRQEVLDSLSSVSVLRLVRPGGKLLLAVSEQGPGHQNDLPDDVLEKQLKGWKIVDRTFARRRDRLIWETETGVEPSADEQRVALITATRANR
jgi:hypothetical protein